MVPPLSAGPSPSGVKQWSFVGAQSVEPRHLGWGGGDVVAVWTFGRRRILQVVPVGIVGSTLLPRSSVSILLVPIDIVGSALLPCPPFSILLVSVGIIDSALLPRPPFGILLAPIGLIDCTLLPRPPFVILLAPPLLLPQQLLRLQQDPGVDSTPCTGVVPGALVAGVAGAVLGCLEAFTGGVGPIPGVLGAGPIPRVLGDGAEVLPGVAGVKRGKKEVIIKGNKTHDFFTPEQGSATLVLRF